MADPQALLRTRGYVGLLVMAAVIGVPVSAAAYGFLALVDYLQKEIFTHLPHGLGFHAEPVLPLVPAVAMGLGAMSVVMLTLPLTSVLLATVLLFSDGLAVTPLVIVAVVVAYVVAARISPADSEDPDASSSPAPPVRAEPGTAKDRQPEPD